jgi:hypothetical protein
MQLERMKVFNKLSNRLHKKDKKLLIMELKKDLNWFKKLKKGYNRMSLKYSNLQKKHKN